MAASFSWQLQRMKGDCTAGPDTALPLERLGQLARLATKEPADVVGLVLARTKEQNCRCRPTLPALISSARQSQMRPSRRPSVQLT